MVIAESILNGFGDSEILRCQQWDRPLGTLPHFGAKNNTTKSPPCLIADVLGDWHEEIILRSQGDTRLMVFVSTIATEYRLRTLMHDPHYRVSVDWQNVGYNQPAHTGFYLGAGMPLPQPVFNIAYVRP